MSGLARLKEHSTQNFIEFMNWKIILRNVG